MSCTARGGLARLGPEEWMHGLWTADLSSKAPAPARKYIWYHYYYQCSPQAPPHSVIPRQIYQVGKISEHYTLSLIKFYVAPHQENTKLMSNIIFNSCIISTERMTSWPSVYHNPIEDWELHYNREREGEREGGGGCGTSRKALVRIKYSHPASHVNCLGLQ